MFVLKFIQVPHHLRCQDSESYLQMIETIHALSQVEPCPTGQAHARSHWLPLRQLLMKVLARLAEVVRFGSLDDYGRDMLSAGGLRMWCRESQAALLAGYLRECSRVACWVPVRLGRLRLLLHVCYVEL